MRRISTRIDVLQEHDAAGRLDDLTRHRVRGARTDGIFDLRRQMFR